MSDGLDKILAMQRDLDAYKFAFTNIMGYLDGRFGKGYKPAIMKGIAASDDVDSMIDAICRKAFELRERYEMEIERNDKRNNDGIERISE